MGQIAIPLGARRLRARYESLGGDKELVVVPTGLQRFDEPAALDAGGAHACRWFSRYLAAPQSRAA